MTEQEQRIYNTFLSVSRSVQNKPFKFRQDFTSLDDSSKLYCMRIANLLNRNRTINYRDYFIAPYEIYGKNERFDLKFYNSRKALVCYTRYMKLKELQNPDNEEYINECKQKLVNIYNYCKANSLSLNQYKSYIRDNVPTTLKHLKDHTINFSIVHGMGINFNGIENDILELYVSNFHETYNKTYSIFISSKKLKNILRQGIFLLEKKLTLDQP